MARQEQPKENLLRDATAFVERIELQVEGVEEHVIVGFRSDGAPSFFFGEDPVFHFNAQNELRRAFRSGLLIKAENGKLASLDRRRQESQVQLVRHDLDDAEQAELIEFTKKTLRQLDGPRFSVVAQVPDNIDLLPRVVSTIQSIVADFRIARRPNA